SLWLTSSASAGVSLVVCRWKRERRIGMPGKVRKPDILPAPGPRRVAGWPAAALPAPARGGCGGASAGPARGAGFPGGRLALPELAIWRLVSAAWRKGPIAPNRTGGGRWKETAFFREGGDDCLARRIGYTRLGPLLILALAACSTSPPGRA